MQNKNTYTVIGNLNKFISFKDGKKFNLTEVKTFGEQVGFDYEIDMK